MRDLLERFSWMPILRLEMRARMRRRWLPLLLVGVFVVVLVECLRTLPLFWMWAAPDSYMHNPWAIELRNADVGRHLLVELAILQAFFILLLAPAFSAASFMRELQQHAFDALALTSMSSAALVIGKLLSAMLFLAVVLFCTLPIISIVFVFGGVSLFELLLVQVALLCLLFCCSAIGVWCSVQFRGHPATFAWAYGLCAVWFIVLPITYHTFYVFLMYGMGYILIMILISILTVLLFFRYGANEELMRNKRHRLNLPIGITALLFMNLLWISSSHIVYRNALAVYWPFHNDFFSPTSQGLLISEIAAPLILLCIGVITCISTIEEVQRMRGAVPR
jgi:hypothetical protein